MLRHWTTVSLRTCCAAAGLLAGVTSCKTTPPTDGSMAEGQADGGQVPAAVEGKAEDAPADKGGFELSYLMTMTWSDAVAISPVAVEIPPFFRVAAEKIEVIKTNADGTPQRVRAKGKVFLEVLYREPARVLCQEAYVGDDEVIIRGRSLLQRGGSVLEGMEDYTVFYMLGTSLRAIGKHRITDEGAMLAQLRLRESMQPGRSGGSDFLDLPSLPPALPVSGPWVGGPNLILPPLSPDAVPETIRAQMRREAEAVEMVPLPVPTGKDAKEEPAASDQVAPKPGAAAPPKGREAASED